MPSPFSTVKGARAVARGSGRAPRRVEWGAREVREPAELPGVTGFSASNLWYMRKFYLVYRDAQKLQPLAGEIGWTHNQVILDRCGDDLEREFYLR